jgi:hypothetical protein
MAAPRIVMAVVVVALADGNPARTRANHHLGVSRQRSHDSSSQDGAQNSNLHRQLLGCPLV